MKNKFSIPWPFVIAALYGMFIVLISLPLVKLAYFHAHAKPLLIKDLVGIAYFKIWAVLMVISSLAFLVVPVRVENKRPVNQTVIVIPIIFSAIMSGLLVVGSFFAITEWFMGEKAFTTDPRILLSPFLLGWSIWALFFSISARKAEARALVDRQCSYLFRGSVLELLIAVPTHVIARNKDYCCAGYFTFFGICLGISVMLISFGPGLYFLYRERWKRITKKRPLEGL